MERRRRSLPLIAAAAAFLVVAAMPYPGEAATPLRKDYYDKSCSNLEAIVREEVARKINETVVTIPATLRLVFHDCMVGVSSSSALPGSQHPDS
jgi:peroxidase